MMSVNNVMNSAAKIALLPVFIAKSVYSEVLCYRKEEKFYKSFPDDIFAISESQAEQAEIKENARFPDAKYKIVIQRHANTCGLTCLAILTGQDYCSTYAETRKYYSERYGIGCDAMKRYLKKHGIQTEEVQRFKIKEMRFAEFVKSKSSSAGILLVKNKGIRAGHFIVFNGKYIYDPMEGVFTVAEYDSYEFVCAWVGVLGS